MTLDGSNDYIQAPGGAIDVSHGITLEAWIFPTAATIYQRFFDLGNGQAKDNILFLRNGTGNDLYVQVFNGATEGPAVIAGGVLELNTWQHIAATIAPDGTAVVYWNGRAVASGTVNPLTDLPRTSNFIGKSNWAGETPFAGSMDEVAIYNGILSGTRIAVHYFAGVGGGAQINRGNTSGGAFGIELNNASNVTLSNLYITGAVDGINVSNGSTNFLLKNSTLFQNASSGLAIMDYGSANAVIQDNVFYGDASDNSGMRDQNIGAYIKGQDPTVLRNQAYHINGWRENGIYLEDVGWNPIVRDNVAWANSATSIYVRAAAYEVSGNVARDASNGFLLEDNNVAQDGNAHDNVAYGISGNAFEVHGYGQVFHNQAYDSTTGFALAGASGTVHDNTAWANSNGFWANSGTVANNRAYGNTTGITMTNGWVTVTGNRVYDNSQTGIWADPYSGNNYITNNLVYDNSGRGIQLNGVQRGGYTMTVSNNTVMELGSNAIEVLSNSQNVVLRNNILWSGGTGHYTLVVADAAQQGFSSDYNDFYTTDGARLGQWQNAFGTLADWRYELGFDTHSIYADPMFVSPAGADGIRGWGSGEGLKFEYFGTQDFTGTPVTTLYDRVIAYGATWGSFRGLPGPGDNQSFRWTGEIYLAQAGTYTFDAATLTSQRLTINGTVVIDDFTNPSRGEKFGTYVAASAGWVTLKFEVADTGGPVEAYLAWSTPDNSTFRWIREYEPVGAGAAGIGAEHSVLRYNAGGVSTGLDDDFHLSSAAGSYHGGNWLADPGTSPAIDGGDLASAFALEAAANGSRVNLGFEGNTPEASHSSSRLIQLLTLTGGEKVRQGQAALILWRSAGLASGDLLSVEFSADGGLTWTQVATSRVNDGGFAWNPTTPTQKGMIRLTSLSHREVVDISNDTFVVGTATRSFYVNDGTTAGDQYTSAVGNNANSGTTRNDPMASLNALLAAYALGPGDVVYVDTGVYNLPTNVRITAADSGVTIIGPSSAAPMGIDYARSVLADAPLAYYRFGDITGTVAKDASGNHLDATYSSGVSLGAPGVIAGDSDTSASFSGTNSYVQLPTGLNPFTNGLTLEAWIFPTANTSYQRYFDLGNGQANNNILFLRSSTSNDLYVQAFSGATAGPTVIAWGVLELNTWQHIAATIAPDGSTVIYKNGRVVASGSVNPLPNEVLNSSYIGQSNWPIDAPYTGRIDEAAIYGTVLQPDRIAAHYYTGTAQGALFYRGNVGSGRYALEIDAATDVTLSNLRFTGAEQGFVAFNADRLTLTGNVSFNNALRGYYVETDVEDAVIRNNIAYGTTGRAENDQDVGFYLRGTRMTVDGNTAYKIGSQFGDGIYIDSANSLTFTHNLAYNNTNGFTVYLSQGTLHDNEARDNSRGLLAYDSDGAQRSTVYANKLHDNDTGLWLEPTVEAYNNLVTSNRGPGIFVNSNANDETWVHDNYVVRNALGIQARAGRVYQNRIVGNTGTGLLLDYSGVYASANVVYGNAIGIEIDGYYAGGSQVLNNLVYQNANFGVYLHGVQYNGSVRIVNNTIYHDIGSAFRMENSTQVALLYNNIIVINGGYGIEVIGNATGFDSNWNDIYTTRPGASIGKFQDSAKSDTLDAWRTASGKDAASIAADPLFIDADGPDNLLGWTQPDPQSQFADFGLDDNYHLRGHSPVIDAGNSSVGPALDSEGAARVDDLATINTGAGPYRFYDLGAFEFTGSSADILPPVVLGLSPIGMQNNTLRNIHVSGFTIHFSEPLQPTSALSSAVYSLVEAGPDHLLGNGDDVPVTIADIGYVPGSQDVFLHLTGELPDGIYRLTLLSGAGASLVDRSGNALDGDANGTAGGNFSRDFRLDLTAPVVASVTPSGSVASTPNRITVVFQENLQMDAAKVTNLANYGLISSVDEQFGNADDVNEAARITGVTFDAATKTATLTLTGALPARRYQLTLRAAITDQVGNQLGNGADSVTLIDVGVPVLDPVGNRSVYDSNTLSFTATATDPDHTGALTFTLGAGAPAGAKISTAGLFTWTPGEALAGQVVQVTIRVTDQNTPALSDSETIAISVLPNPAPVVQSFTVNDGSAQRSYIRSLSLGFNIDISGALTLGTGLSLVNLTTGAAVPGGALALSFLPGGNTAVLTFPGLAGGLLPDGNYRLTVRAAGIVGPHGKPMAADATFTFSALTGDLNGDGVVNSVDLLLVWQELLKPAASRSLAVDVNGDGQVNQADLDLLKANYLASTQATAPRFLGSTVNSGLTQRSRLASLALQFDANVGASLTAADFILKNTTTQAVVTGLTVFFDPVLRQATVTAPALADGNYDLTVIAAGITDAKGTPMAADVHVGFFILAGDANGDRVVNDLDLLQVWQDTTRPAASRSLNNDLTGDAQVTAADVAVVEAHYLATLAPAPVPPTLQLRSIGLADGAVVIDPVATPLSLANPPPATQGAATAPMTPSAAPARSLIGASSPVAPAAVAGREPWLSTGSGVFAPFWARKPVVGFEQPSEERGTDLWQSLREEGFRPRGVHRRGPQNPGSRL